MFSGLTPEEQVTVIQAGNSIEQHGERGVFQLSAFGISFSQHPLELKKKS